MPFKDAEARVRSWALSRVPFAVETRVPNPRPDRVARVWRSGGAAASRILDAPILTFTVWNSTDPAVAAADAGLLRDVLYRTVVVTLPGVTRIEEVAGLYFDPDPDTDSARYTFSAQLWLRA
jgi:hypothetical protein